MQNSKSSLLGIIWMLIFGLTSTTSDVVVRYLTVTDFPAGEIIFIRCFLGTLILLPIVWRDKSLWVSKAVFKLYVARGVFAFMAIAIYFYILKYAEFTALVAIGFTAPLFVAIFAILFLGERIGYIKITALLLGFSGAMVIIDPFNANMELNIYLLIAMVSAFLWAVSLIFTKQLSHNQKPLTVAFFFSLIVTPLSFVLALYNWQWPTMVEWGYLILILCLSTIAHITLAKAFKYADLLILMPFEYSNLIFAMLFSYIIFGDIVAFNTILGGTIILASGYIVIRSEARKKHKPAELELVP